MIALLQATFPTRDEAERVGRLLVEERLVACVNIIGACRSIYRWQGTVENADEVLLQCKTLPGLAATAATRLATLHPYDTPVVEHWTAATTDAADQWLAAALDAPV